MSYGLRVFGVAGYAQIDHDYRNFEIAQTGSVYCPSSPWDYGTGVDVSAYGTMPMVFFRCSDPNIYMTMTYFLGGRLYFYRTDATAQVSSPGYVEYMIAVPKRVTPSAESYGLRVYDASGNLAFDSGFRSPRVFTIATVTPNPVAYGGVEVYFDSAISNPWISAWPTMTYESVDWIRYDDPFSYGMNSSVFPAARISSAGVLDIAAVDLTNQDDWGAFFYDRYLSLSGDVTFALAKP